MSVNYADNKSTLVKIMAWYRQVTSHGLSRCSPSYVSPYGVTRLQWVNDRSRECVKPTGLQPESPLKSNQFSLIHITGTFNSLTLFQSGSLVFRTAVKYPIFPNEKYLVILLVVLAVVIEINRFTALSFLWSVWSRPLISRLAQAAWSLLT